MTKFMVNGQEKELRYDVKGIDISGDFIGNTSHGMKSDSDGRYIATQADFDWWQSTISAHENMNNIIADYKCQFDPDEVDKVAWDWGAGHDLENVPTQTLMGLRKVLGKL